MIKRIRAFIHAHFTISDELTSAMLGSHKDIGDVW